MNLTKETNKKQGQYSSHVDAINKKSNYTWLLVIAWMMVTFALLMQFEPPTWVVSYCLPKI